MKDTYLSIRCRVPAELEEELPALLEPWSVLGVEIHSESDGRIGATVYLRGTDVNGARGVSRALADCGAQEIDQMSREAEDWLSSFRELSQPFPVGRRWWIDPHPGRPTAAPAGRQRLAVEPRMAFGSGSHESTRTILEALEEIDLKGRRVLDVGTGSAILALAAESLGAEFVIGLDIDPGAVWVAFETARQQEWPSRVEFILGPVDCLGGAVFDIVLCNMMSSSFLPLVGDLRNSLAPGGVAVFSGLLVSELDSVSKKLIQKGFTMVSQRVLGDWASLTVAAAPVP